MCPETSIDICPNLMGSSDGAMCKETKEFVRNIQDVTIKMCMSRRYEACQRYCSSLQRLPLHPGSFARAL